VARQYAYMLTAISVLASMLGYGGLTLLIDESEHYSLLRANQRERADSFFKALIYAALGQANSRVDPKTIPYHGSVDYELTFASEPHLFFMFALTESENRMPVDAWLAPSQILRLRLPAAARTLRAGGQDRAGPAFARAQPAPDQPARGNPPGRHHRRPAVPAC